MPFSSMSDPVAPAHGHVLHVATGLQQLMGDRALYLQILRRFRHRYHDSANQARTELNAGDAASTRRTLHTLKGAAGMIGAQQVYLLSAAVEQASVGPPAQCMGPLGQLEQALRALMAAIDAEFDAGHDGDGAGGTMEAQASEPRPADGPPPATRMLVQHLARLLEEGDGAAIDVLEQSATVLAASLGVEVFQEVTEAAHQFDFEAALAVLQAARDR